jgi:exodeoxyribonuclease III
MLPLPKILTVSSMFSVTIICYRNGDSQTHLFVMYFITAAFKVASWNVVSLRALLRNQPHALEDLVRKYDLDMLCLQETKLQESHLEDPKANLTTILEGYTAYYSCSTVKKGYAGTAVFVRQRKGMSSNPTKKKTITSFFTKKKSDVNETTTVVDSVTATSINDDKTNDTPLPIDETMLIPQNVSFKMGTEKHDGEGRIIVVDYSWGTLCNVYVPNAGQNLDRLSYRTDEWDKDLLAFAKRKQQERQRPVMWLGDLNVAHTHLEVWNDGAKHLSKQAGITPEERASFQAQLDSGFVDAFRRLHPTAQGHYSYWSQRAGNRAPNRGLRLDYFICDTSFFDETGNAIVRDSYIDPSCMGSDHCPVILEIQLKPTKTIV